MCGDFALVKEERDEDMPRQLRMQQVSTPSLSCKLRAFQPTVVQNEDVSGP